MADQYRCISLAPRKRFQRLQIIPLNQQIARIPVTTAQFRRFLQQAIGDCRAVRKSSSRVSRWSVGMGAFCSWCLLASLGRPRREQANKGSRLPCHVKSALNVLNPYDVAR